MPLKQEGDRHQIQMISLEEMVPLDDDARVIDAFVEALDLKSFGFDIKGGKRTGRSAYPAGMLLKLYLLGYRNGIRSSRQLEKACAYDLRYKWLLKELRPKYKTISEFRRINRSCFKEVFRSFVLLLQEEKLISGKTLALDGVKIRAWNSKKNNYNKKKISAQLDYIDRRVEVYLGELDKSDNEEEREQVAKKIEKQKERRKKYEKLESDLEASGDLQISTTDPDARSFVQRRSLSEICYNIQTATDNKNNLLTEFTVTNENDTHGLYETTKAAKDLLKLKKLTVLADKGYPTGSELKKCAEANITTYVSPRNNASKNRKEPAYRIDKFKYNKKKDSYTCPENQELTSNGSWYEKNKGAGKKSYKVKVYKCSFSVCKACEHKLKCAGESNLKSRRGRPIERSEYADYVESNKKRVSNNMDFYRTRQQIVEHPFGTLKRHWHFGFTLLKTMEKVEAEVGIIYLCYNLVRTSKILSPKTLIEKLKGMRISMLLLNWLILRRYQAVK